MSEGNVIRGHKANLSNKSTSDESKENSLKYLQEHDPEEYPPDEGSGQQSHPRQTSGSSTGSASQNVESVTHGKDAGNVMRGLKATISNPNVSEEAKERAHEKLDVLEGAE
ncbi:hypothetical protein SAICODRAFT_7434 [Saitoella complicata NRRL Y-17804]|uniref:Conidiation protein 6 n=1 Tax=Saitoella complicata (strain BCRC 22490 / CBS 7301 / JCM 7358 / NBRC 10748 / NRRL Y-17804) TaxID=698492 RepID=A0A0E9N9F3_SAICN|nr:uncharacterized protein SAICODRAFT_7434 [Saitoella complicata NRRL Y-17804]ODQ53288.1 hypothetical protein SAICODRAFT_7434 [Saitoella complicata NRRL Y-17804]GAO46413.1 hypothetical protein G7K_0644-t1 [Saitoella complicata NRRL Y-17804]